MLARRLLGNCNLVQLGLVSAEQPVPEHIVKPDYYYDSTKTTVAFGEPEIKSPQAIERMRSSCRLAAKILKKCSDIVKVFIYFTLKIRVYLFSTVCKTLKNRLEQPPMTLIALCTRKLLKPTLTRHHYVIKVFPSPCARP